MKLCDARLRICETGASSPGDHGVAWQVLFELVDTLGVNGTSSDESDGEDHAVRFKQWRSIELRNLLTYVDDNRIAVNTYGNPLSGARPRKRIRGRHPPISKSSAVPCLPMNFYDQAWYDSLTERQQFDLDSRDAIALPELA